MSDTMGIVYVDPVNTQAYRETLAMQTQFNRMKYV